MCPTPPPPIRDPQDPPPPRARPLRRDPAPPPGSPAAWPGGARWRRRKGLGRGPAPPAGNSTGTGCWGHRRVSGAPRGGPPGCGACPDPAPSPCPMGPRSGSVTHPPNGAPRGHGPRARPPPQIPGNRPGDSGGLGAPHCRVPHRGIPTPRVPHRVSHPGQGHPEPPRTPCSPCAQTSRGGTGCPQEGRGAQPGQWQRLAVPRSVLGTQLGSSTQSSRQKWMCQRDTRPSRSRQAPDGGSDQDECLCLCARQHRPVQAWVSPEFSNVTEKHRERCYGCYCF